MQVKKNRSQKKNVLVLRILQYSPRYFPWVIIFFIKIIDNCCLYCMISLSLFSWSAKRQINAKNKDNKQLCYLAAEFKSCIHAIQNGCTLLKYICDICFQPGKRGMNDGYFAFKQQSYKKANKSGTCRDCTFKRGLT